MAPRYSEDSDVSVEVNRKLQRPKLYRVLLHNDNYTYRDFVVEILRSIFHHSENEAIRIMMQVHQNGIGVAGTFTREIAETKIEIVTQLAREHEFPLLLTMEPEDQPD